MQVKNWYLYTGIVFIHACLLYLAFPSFFHDPANTLFCNWGDGIKNYFTLASFVNEPIGKDGIFKYNTFFYPFGDYVYYTDNTPVFSLIYRVLFNSAFNICNYVIPVFNSLILLNIIIAGLLLYHIFNKIVGRNVFSFIMAIYLPWVNLQVIRIPAGHFNLSLSSILLTAIVLCIHWGDNKIPNRRRIWIFSGMFLLVCLSFLVHGYYIAILLLFLCFYLFISGLFRWRESLGKQSVLASVLLLIISGAACFGLVASTDRYMKIRSEVAMLYDWSIFKTNFQLLFTHFDFHTLGFPVASSRVLDVENMVYLNNVGLFAFGAFLFGAFFSTKFRSKLFSVQKMFFSDPFRKSIFFSGLVLFFVSFGDWYTTNRDKVVIYTPFPYLNQLDAGLLLLYIVLLSIFIYGCVLVFHQPSRMAFKQIIIDYKLKPWKKIKLLLLAALIIYLFVAHYAVTVINVFNPLLYLHLITKRVEQFRCLDRFLWVFYWIFYIWIIYTVYHLYLQYSIRTQQIIILIIVLIAGVEIKDYVIHFKKNANFENLFAGNQLDKFKKLTINLSQFQSIIPVPYYVVGSEDYPHTIDDDNNWSIQTMQLSLYSRLPLMAGRMSRTPPEYSIELLNFVGFDSLSTSLRQRLNDKPILIMLDKGRVSDAQQIDRCARDRPVSRDYYKRANEFVARHRLMPIDSIGSVYFYGIRIKNGTIEGLLL